MTDLPAPLTPPEADLSGFPFMPLEVKRLRRSKSWLKCKRKPELAFYQVNLWIASWHSTPPASLENDDDVLADLAMCSPEKWDELKGEILAGWVTCSDGRLYHPTVAEKANEAWQSKLDGQWKRVCGALKKQCQRTSAAYVQPPFSLWLSWGQPSPDQMLSPGHSYLSPGQWALDGDGPAKTPNKREGEGEGEGERQGQQSKSPSKGGDRIRLRPLTSDSDRAIAMTLDWMPTDAIKDRLHIAGVFPSWLTQEAISEFASYWQSRDGMATNAEWEHKLVQHLKRTGHKQAQTTKAEGVKHHGDTVQSI